MRMWLRETILFKKDSVETWVHVKCKSLPNGEFRLVEEQFWDGDPVTRRVQAFNTEKEVDAAFQRRIKELAQQGFIFQIPTFPNVGGWP